MFTKKRFIIFLFSVMLCIIPTVCFAQTNPTITSPSSNTSTYSRGDIKITWNPVSGAKYLVSIRDMTVNLKVLNGVSTGTATSYTLLKKYLYEGHIYRIAVSATVGSTVTWGERIFTVNLSTSKENDIIKS